MTFDEYNTDETFKGDSTADELVRLAKEEKKERADVENSLSPLWKEDKKGNVKKALDKYYPSETPKEEPKAEEAPKVEEMTQTAEALAEPKTEQKEEKAPYTSPLESEDTGVKKSDKSYLDEVNAILNEEQKEELKKWSKTSVDNYNRTMENMERSGDAFKKIDDRLIEQLPTFFFRRYQNGEFGEPGSKDAKLRLAHFMLNGVQTALRRFSNGAALAAGKSPMYANEMSDYEKYQMNNLTKGMENRWKKYEAETDSAIKMVQDRNVSEEDALNIINKISMNNRLQNAFNMADANKKAYMIEVLSKVGDKVSNWNDQKFINSLIGAEITGEDVGNAAALIGARAGGKILDNFNLFDENGNLDLTALKNVINIPGAKDKLKDMGIDVDKIDFDSASVGGSDTTDKDSGSATSVRLSDGTNIDVGKMMSLNDFSGISKAASKLSDRYYRGEITEEQFRTDYNKLYNLVQSHNIMNKLTGTLKPIDKRVKELKGEKVDYWDRQIEDLNNQAKNGLIKPSDYNEKFAEFEKLLVSAGGDAKKTAKKKMSTEAIIKANEKIDKEKKKRR